MKNQLSNSYETSSAQKRMFTLNQIAKDDTNYNMPFAIIIEGDLMVERLVQCLHSLVDRQEAFRTSFELIGQEVVQKIHEAVDLNIEFDEIEDGNESIDTEIEAFVKPFDLLTPPLVRFKLCKMGRQKYLFLIDMHHVISDGTSGYIIVDEISKLYEGEKLEKLSYQYKDYAKWHNELLEGESIKAQEKYWLDAFQGELPVLNMPTDFTRPAVQSYSGDYVKFTLDREKTKKIKQISNQHRVTPYMLLLSTYFTLLSKYSNQEDIIIGTPIAGRFDEEHQKIVGMFVNTLAIRGAVQKEMSFMELLQQVKETCIDAYKNQSYPFDRLIDKLNLEKDLSRNSLFDIMFIMQNMEQKEFQMGSNTFEFYDVRTHVAKFDLTLMVTEKNGELILGLEYADSLYTKETAEKILSHYIKILEDVMNDFEQRIEDIDPLNKAERKMLLEDFNPTKSEYEHNKKIEQLFEEQVEKHPNSIALVCGERSLTYKELNEKSNAIANILRHKGIGSDDIVGLLAERSMEMIVGLLGILKAGGAYLPIDPDYPMDRITYMLEDSASKVLLIKGTSLEGLDFGGEVIDLGDHSLYQGKHSNLESIGDAGSLAYVIYTSGSTGKPKGVMIEHRNVINFCVGIENNTDINPEDTMLSLTTISFDIFVLEMIYPLLYGVKTVLFEKSTLIEAKEIQEAIEKNHITLMQVTPSRLKGILYDQNNGFLKHIKTIFIGGEALEASVLEKLKQLTKAQIFNMYGPTEATVWATMADLTEEEQITIGAPMANVRIYILDHKARLLPSGVWGELCIGGDGLARGYLNRKELTDEKFIENPYEPGKKLYKTGDLARWTTEGKIEFLGRIDNQVKIRGYRIELGEIENSMLSMEDMNEVAVVPSKVGNVDVLVAYYTSTYPYTSGKITSELQEKLPEYMIPAYFYHIEEMPHTPNGKIDRNALLKNYYVENTASEEEYIAPSTQMEKFLEEIWSELLGTERIGIHENFFSLGGNSLLLVQMHSKIDAIYPDQIKVVDLFKYPTISKLADFLAKETKEVFVEETAVTLEQNISDLFDELEDGNLSVDDLISRLEDMGD